MKTSFLSDGNTLVIYALKQDTVTPLSANGGHGLS